MFTGLVADVGEVVALEPAPTASRLTVATRLAADLAPGDSVAVDGVCLTAVASGDGRFAADVVPETLARSSLGEREPGDRVNLELALRASDRLGGHLVQGHVDGVGTVAEVLEDAGGRLLVIDASSDLLRYVVGKGSIAVQGVSLTVAAVSDRSFSVALIPETLARTTLGDVRVGDHVSLEVDLLAKYVEKLKVHA
jgi:riboflavin synthase